MDDVMSLVQEYMMDSVRKTIQEHCCHSIESKLSLYEEYGSDYEDDEENDEEDKIKILKIADKFGFHDVMCKAAQYVSFKHERYTTFNKSAGEHTFSDKATIKICANIIKRNAKKVEEFIQTCKACRAVDPVRLLIIIQGLSGSIASESILKDV